MVDGRLRCHFASDVQTTTGPKESRIHLLLAEVGLLIIASLPLKITSPVLMIASWLLHNVTATWT